MKLYSFFLRAVSSLLIFTFLFTETIARADAPSVVKFTHASYLAIEKFANSVDVRSELRAQGLDISEPNKPQGADSSGAGNLESNIVSPEISKAINKLKESAGDLKAIREAIVDLHRLGYKENALAEIINNLNQEQGYARIRFWPQELDAIFQLLAKRARWSSSIFAILLPIFCFFFPHTGSTLLCFYLYYLVMHKLGGSYKLLTFKLGDLWNNRMENIQNFLVKKYHDPDHVFEDRLWLNTVDWAQDQVFDAKKQFWRSVLNSVMGAYAFSSIMIFPWIFSALRSLLSNPGFLLQVGGGSLLAILPIALFASIPLRGPYFKVTEADLALEHALDLQRLANSGLKWPQFSVRQNALIEAARYYWDSNHFVRFIKKQGGHEFKWSQQIRRDTKERFLARHFLVITLLGTTALSLILLVGISMMIASGIYGAVEFVIQNFGKSLMTNVLLVLGSCCFFPIAGILLVVVVISGSESGIFSAWQKAKADIHRLKQNVFLDPRLSDEKFWRSLTKQLKRIEKQVVRGSDIHFPASLAQLINDLSYEKRKKSKLIPLYKTLARSELRSEYDQSLIDIQNQVEQIGEYFLENLGPRLFPRGNIEDSSEIMAYFDNETVQEIFSKISSVTGRMRAYLLTESRFFELSYSQFYFALLALKEGLEMQFYPPKVEEIVLEVDQQLETLREIAATVQTMDLDRLLAELLGFYKEGRPLKELTQDELKKINGLKFALSVIYFDHRRILEQVRVAVGNRPDAPMSHRVLFSHLINAAKKNRQIAMIRMERFGENIRIHHRDWGMAPIGKRKNIVMTGGEASRLFLFLKVLAGFDLSDLTKQQEGKFSIAVNSEGQKLFSGEKSSEMIYEFKVEFDPELTKKGDEVLLIYVDRSEPQDEYVELSPRSELRHFETIQADINQNTRESLRTAQSARSRAELRYLKTDPSHLFRETKLSPQNEAKRAELRMPAWFEMAALGTWLVATAGVIVLFSITIRNARRSTTNDDIELDQARSREAKKFDVRDDRRSELRNFGTKRKAALTVLVASIMGLASCASRLARYPEIDRMLKNDDYDVVASGLKEVSDQKIPVDLEFLRPYLIHEESPVAEAALKIIEAESLPVTTRFFKPYTSKFKTNKKYVADLNVSELIDLSVDAGTEFERMMSNFLVAKVFPTDSPERLKIIPIKIPLLHFLQDQARFLEKMNPERQIEFVKKVSKLLLKKRAEIIRKNEIILGPGRRLVVATDGGGDFDFESIRETVKKFGASVSDKDIFKGSKDLEKSKLQKNLFLSTLRSLAHGKKSETVWAYGHGESDYFSLFGEQKEDIIDAQVITPQEFAEALLSGFADGAKIDLNHLIFILDFCYSFDMAEEMLEKMTESIRHLATGRNISIQSFPVMISIVNRGRPGYENVFDESLKRLAEEQSGPLTVGTLIEDIDLKLNEQRPFWHDPALWVPLTDAEIKEIKESLNLPPDADVRPYLEIAQGPEGHQANLVRSELRQAGEGNEFELLEIFGSNASIAAYVAIGLSLVMFGYVIVQWILGIRESRGKTFQELLGDSPSAEPPNPHDLNYAYTEVRSSSNSGKVKLFIRVKRFIAAPFVIFLSLFLRAVIALNMLRFADAIGVLTLVTEVLRLLSIFCEKDEKIDTRIFVEHLFQNPGTQEALIQAAYEWLQVPYKPAEGGSNLADRLFQVENASQGFRFYLLYSVGDGELPKADAIVGVRRLAKGLEIKLARAKDVTHNKISEDFITTLTKKDFPQYLVFDPDIIREKRIAPLLPQYVPVKDPKELKIAKKRLKFVELADDSRVIYKLNNPTFRENRALYFKLVFGVNRLYTLIELDDFLISFSTPFVRGIITWAIYDFGQQMGMLAIYSYITTLAAILMTMIFNPVIARKMSNIVRARVDIRSRFASDQNGKPTLQQMTAREQVNFHLMKWLKASAIIFLFFQVLFFLRIPVVFEWTLAPFGLALPGILLTIYILEDVISEIYHGISREAAQEFAESSTFDDETFREAGLTENSANIQSYQDIMDSVMQLASFIFGAGIAMISSMGVIMGFVIGISVVEIASELIKFLYGKTYTSYLEIPIKHIPRRGKDSFRLAEGVRLVDLRNEEEKKRSGYGFLRINGFSRALWLERKLHKIEFDAKPVVRVKNSRLRMLFGGARGVAEIIALDDSGRELIQLRIADHFHDMKEGNQFEIREVVAGEGEIAKTHYELVYFPKTEASRSELRQDSREPWVASRVLTQDQSRSELRSRRSQFAELTPSLFSSEKPVAPEAPKPVEINQTASRLYSELSDEEKSDPKLIHLIRESLAFFDYDKTEIKQELKRFKERFSGKNSADPKTGFYEDAVLAYVDGVPAGVFYFDVNQHFHRAEDNGVFVLPEFRGQASSKQLNIGRRLFDDCVSYLKTEKEIKAIWIGYKEHQISENSGAQTWIERIVQDHPTSVVESETEERDGKMIYHSVRLLLERIDPEKRSVIVKKPVKLPAGHWINPEFDLTPTEMERELLQTEEVQSAVKSLGLKVYEKGEKLWIDGFKEPIEFRSYQVMLAAHSTLQDSVVILPTGLGKTNVALFRIRYLLEQYRRDPDFKIVMTAPSNPLADQHWAYFQSMIPESVLSSSEIVRITSKVPAEKRIPMWQRGKLIIVTDQLTVGGSQKKRKDKNTLPIEEAGFLIMDEGHVASGEHASVEALDTFRSGLIFINGTVRSIGNESRPNALINDQQGSFQSSAGTGNQKPATFLALTATPPPMKDERDQAWLKTLGITDDGVLATSFDDPWIEPYIHARYIKSELIKRDLRWPLIMAMKEHVQFLKNHLGSFDYKYDLDGNFNKAVYQLQESKSPEDTKKAWAAIDNVMDYAQSYLSGLLSKTKEFSAVLDYMPSINLLLRASTLLHAHANRETQLEKINLFPGGRFQYQVPDPLKRTPMRRMLKEINSDKTFVKAELEKIKKSAPKLGSDDANRQEYDEAYLRLTPAVFQFASQLMSERIDELFSEIIDESLNAYDAVTALSRQPVLGFSDPLALLPIRKNRKIPRTEAVNQAMSAAYDYARRTRDYSYANRIMRLYHLPNLLRVHQQYGPIHLYRAIQEQYEKDSESFLETAHALKKSGILSFVKWLSKNKVRHRKIRYLIDWLKPVVGKPYKAIIFVGDRAVAQELVEVLSANLGTKVGLLVGRSGMTMKQQEEVVHQFNQGEFQFLVATQVAEEGLDFKEADIAISYEPATSVRQLVQRMGRISRHKLGTYLTLAAKDTIEELMLKKIMGDYKRTKQWIRFYQRRRPYTVELPKRSELRHEKSFENIPDEKMAGIIAAAKEYFKISDESLQREALNTYKKNISELLQNPAVIRQDVFERNVVKRTQRKLIIKEGDWLIDSENQLLRVIDLKRGSGGFDQSERMGGNLKKRLLLVKTFAGVGAEEEMKVSELSENGWRVLKYDASREPKETPKSRSELRADSRIVRLLDEKNDRLIPAAILYLDLFLTLKEHKAELQDLTGHDLFGIASARHPQEGAAYKITFTPPNQPPKTLLAVSSDDGGERYNQQETNHPVFFKFDSNMNLIAVYITVDTKEPKYLELEILQRAEKGILKPYFINEEIGIQNRSGKLILLNQPASFRLFASDLVLRASLTSEIRSELRREVASSLKPDSFETLDVQESKAPEVRSELRKISAQLKLATPKPSAETTAAFDRRFGIRSAVKSTNPQILGILPNLGRLEDLRNAIIESKKGRNKIVVFTGTKEELDLIQEYLDSQQIPRDQAVVTRVVNAQTIFGDQLNAELVLVGLPSDKMYAFQATRLLRGFKVVTKTGTVEEIENDFNITDAIRSELRQRMAALIAA